MQTISAALNKASNTPLSSIRDESGNFFVDETAHSNYIKNYFKAVYKKHRDTESIFNFISLNENLVPPNVEGIDFSCLTSTFTGQELANVIADLRPGAAAGLDNIGNQLIVNI